MDFLICPIQFLCYVFSGRLFALFFTRGCIMEPIIDFNRAIERAFIDELAAAKGLTLAFSLSIVLWILILLTIYNFVSF